MLQTGARPEQHMLALAVGFRPARVAIYACWHWLLVRSSSDVHIDGPCVIVQGKRYSLPSSRIMIHQPLGGAQGQAADIEIQANEILHHKLTLNGYLAEFSGQGMERITQDTGRHSTVLAAVMLSQWRHGTCTDFSSCMF